MEQARHKIAAALAHAHLPAVLWSGGKDSGLLLHLAREVHPTIPAVWFRTGAPDYGVRRLIHQLHLTVYTFPATDRYLLCDDSPSLITEYNISGTLLPVVTDITPGTDCILQYPVLQPFRAELPFDVLLWGARESDAHWLKGDTPMRADGWQLGRATVTAPLRHMSDEQVHDAIFNMRIPYIPDTDLPVCAQCMTSTEPEVFCPEQQARISTIKWDKAFNTRMFRKRYGLKAA